jgi:hypothetical protein
MYTFLIGFFNLNLKRELMDPQGYLSTLTIYGNFEACATFLMGVPSND